MPEIKKEKTQKILKIIPVSEKVEKAVKVQKAEIPPKAEKPPAVSVIEKFCALYPVLISGNKYMQLHLQHQKLRVQAESTVFRNLYNLSGYRNRNIWLVLLLCKCSWLLEEIFFRLPESASLGIKWLLSGYERL